MVEVLSLNRPFLESLTTAELIKLADKQGIDVPPGLDRTIIIEELLETLGENENSADKKSSLPLEEQRLSTMAPLPKYYNISYVEVLIRDPLWAFAFWEINAHDKEIHEKAADFGGYCLKVVSKTEGPDGDGSFTVPVGIGDSAWYLGFPPSGGAFTVELCVLRREETVVLAVSKPFRLPDLLESLENRDSKSTDNPLLQLSGVDDFKILHDTSRSSRVPKRIGVNAAGPRR